MPRFLSVARDSKGDVVPSPTVNVYLPGTTTAASIFSDAALTVAKANPFTGETDGEYDFYVREGKYRLVITATGFTTFDKDNVPISEAIDPVVALIEKSGTQTFTTGVLAQVTGFTEIFDFGGLYTATEDRLVIVTGGIYSVDFGVRWASDATAYRLAEVQVNAALAARDSEQAANGTSHYSTSSRLLSLSAGDILTLHAQQASGGNLDVQAGLGTYLGAQLVRAA